MRARAALLGLLLACAAPEPQPRTELVVVVDTDLALGAELDALRIDATGPNETLQSASGSLAAGTELPHTLGLVHEAGPLGPLRVVAIGTLDGEEILRREAELSFIADKTLTLTLHLVRACVGRVCGAQQTCTEHGCAAVSVDATRLSPWRGSPPTLAEPGEPPDAGEELDAGSDAAAPDLDAGGEQEAGPTEDDAAMCVPKVEACNEADDDCDGVVDNGYDLTTDTRHCGKCNQLCKQPTAICCKGSCARNCAN